MTRMMASVEGPDEAEAAIAGGADLVGLDDPAQGPCGAVSPALLTATVGRVAGRRPISAAAGSLGMEPVSLLAGIEALGEADFLRIGIAPGSSASCRPATGALRAIAARMKLIAVFLGDGSPDLSLLADLAEAGFAGAMIDTLEEGGAGLLKHWSAGALGRFVAACRENGLTSGLAGSLEAPDVPRLVVLEPDYLGFRSALRRGGRRDAPIDIEAAREIRALLDAGAGDGAPDAGETDCIFVRDLTADMEVGAYGFERNRTQKVRFSVEADILRPSRPARGMTDIYSYDLIMDAVRTLVARGHTDLVETLAEDLAATLLRDRRVAAVTIRVEKLELGPAAVGIEIRRRSLHRGTP